MPYCIFLFRIQSAPPFHDISLIHEIKKICFSNLLLQDRIYFCFIWDLIQWNEFLRLLFVIILQDIRGEILFVYHRVVLASFVRSKLHLKIVISFWALVSALFSHTSLDATSKKSCFPFCPFTPEVTGERYCKPPDSLLNDQVSIGSEMLVGKPCQGKGN
jgi:hypothetical protein